MITLGLTAVGSVIAAFIMAFKLVALGVILLVLAFALFLLRGACLYRPPENHLGVIYRFGRFSRLAGPDQLTFVIPGVDEITKEVSLDPRRAELSVFNLWSKDRAPMNCELLVIYRLDLRRTHKDSLLRAVRIPDEAWSSIVSTVLKEVAAEVVGHNTRDELLGPAGRGEFRFALSKLLADRLKDLGLVINAQRGVSVQDIQPASTIQQALEDRSAADALGEATQTQIRPLLDELRRRRPGIGLDALLVQLAAAVAKDGAIREPLTMSENVALLAALLERQGKRELAGQPTNGIAPQDDDGRHQMELPLRMD